MLRVGSIQAVLRFLVRAGMRVGERVDPVSATVLLLSQSTVSKAAGKRKHSIELTVS